MDVGSYLYFPAQEEVDTLQQITKGHREQDLEDALTARTQTVEELNQELEETGPDFGTETVQQVKALLRGYAILWWGCMSCYIPHDLETI